MFQAKVQKDNQSAFMNGAFAPFVTHNIQTLLHKPVLASLMRMHCRSHINRPYSLQILGLAQNKQPLAEHAFCCPQLLCMDAFQKNCAEVPSYRHTDAAVLVLQLVLKVCSNYGANLPSGWK